jgi:hypothetical protein
MDRRHFRLRLYAEATPVVVWRSLAVGDGCPGVLDFDSIHHHAWLTDADGNAIDLAWPEPGTST